MTDDDIREIALRPGLVWGFDFIDGRRAAVSEADLLEGEPPRGFRWLHFNLADQRTLRWLSANQPVSPALTADVLLSVDPAQQCLIDQEAAGIVLHDFELDFFRKETRIGVFRILVSPAMIVTARSHPIRSADAVKRRIDAGAVVADGAAALDLILAAMIDVYRGVNAELDAQVQEIEDELLKDRPSTDPRTFTTLRSLMVRIHRLYSGARAVFRGLDEENRLPEPLREPASRFVARLSGVDQDLLAIQSQLRLLRDEMDLQAAQQTNDTLYFLSLLSALLLPATLVTGIFGMNTGGLPWAHSGAGSLWATGIALGSSVLVYAVLRLMGFIRR